MNYFILTAVFISFLWGIAPVIQKHLLHTINPNTMLLFYSISYTLCVILYSIYNWKVIHNDIVKHMNIRYFIIILLLGLGVGFLANVLYFHILHKKDSYIVNALVCSSPLFTMIIAYLFINEKLHMRGVIGVMCIIIGIVLIAFNEGKQTSQLVSFHE